MHLQVRSLVAVGVASFVRDSPFVTESPLQIAQGRHRTLPEPAAKESPGHGVHEVCPFWFCYAPASHACRCDSCALCAALRSQIAAGSLVVLFLDLSGTSQPNAGVARGPVPCHMPGTAPCRFTPYSEPRVKDNSCQPVSHENSRCVPAVHCEHIIEACRGSVKLPAKSATSGWRRPLTHLT